MEGEPKYESRMVLDQELFSAYQKIAGEIEGVEIGIEARAGELFSYNTANKEDKLLIVGPRTVGVRVSFGSMENQVAFFNKIHESEEVQKLLGDDEGVKRRKL